MKKILLAVNFILAIIIIIFFISNLIKSGKDSEMPHISSYATKNDDVVVANKKTEIFSLPEGQEAVDKIISSDFFNAMRSPLASIRGGRTEMVLLGIFHVGEIQGAIIRQNGSTRQINPYIAQMIMMGEPGGTNRGQQGNNGSNRTRGGRRNFGGGLDNSQNINNNNQSVRQYVKVGETLTNGYTLVEVSRQKAILVRGNDKLELELQDPSKNKVASSSNNNNNRQNQFLQFQSAQMFMQSQMLRSLQRMEQNTQNNNGQRNNGRGRR